MACSVAIKIVRFRQVSQPRGRAFGCDVTLRTGKGDGHYPVMALIKDGMVKAIMIEFLSDEFVKALMKDIAPEKRGEVSNA